MKVSYQGSLDGLCGMYAIINCIDAAFVKLGEKQKKEMFKTACLSLSSKRWPKLLWKGTSFGDMRTMIAACLELEVCKNIAVSYPFLKREPSNNEEYWDQLREIMDAKNARVAIVGLEQPSEHWMGIGFDGGRIQILDGSAETPFQRKNLANVIASNNELHGTKWRVNLKEAAVFSTQ